MRIHSLSFLTLIYHTICDSKRHYINIIISRRNSHNNFRNDSEQYRDYETVFIIPGPSQMKNRKISIKINKFPNCHVFVLVFKQKSALVLLLSDCIEFWFCPRNAYFVFKSAYLKQSVDLNTLLCLSLKWIFCSFFFRFTSNQPKLLSLRSNCHERFSSIN